MGVEHLRLRAHESGPVDYTVTAAANTDPWFAGTGFKQGDKVLDVVGNEWDSLPTPPPAECVKGLTVLFEYPGVAPELPADAVRYTAPSGARVFAGGAQQLSWPLDTALTAGLGLSFGFQLPTVIVPVQKALDLTDTGIGLSTVMFFRLIGGAFGVALLTALLVGEPIRGP